MKLEVMKKEEALLLELDLMKEDKLKKDEENDKLRQQLNEMKAKMEKVQGLSMRTLDVWSFFTA